LADGKDKHRALKTSWNPFRHPQPGASLCLHLSHAVTFVRAEFVLENFIHRMNRLPVLILSLFCVIRLEAQQEIPRSPKEYRDFANGHDGDPDQGKQLFNSERLACAKCHSVDGSAAKAGPDLYAVADKFPRRDLIQAILEPNASIAVGYGATLVERKSGEEVLGIIKQATDSFVELMAADGQKVRILTSDIQAQKGSNVSLMPDGLQAGLTRQEFADLITYLSTLRQPENAVSSSQAMPAEIPRLAKQVPIRPFISDELRFPHAYVFKPGDVRYGLVYFTQVPGETNHFLAIHQTGKIWLIEKNSGHDRKTLFGDFGSELFNERGPNGLLGFAFHPNFRQNRRYFLKLQVFETGKIATTVVEKEAAPDLLHDSGKPSRRLLKIVCVTQDHTGGCIQFGPDGYLYVGMGDTGPQQDPQGHGQDLQTLLGKMLRIDVDHRDADLPYAIPADNPFQNRSDARAEIWAPGFREPWRFSFDIVTGDLWVGDVGQDRVEEVDVVRRGENYGWNVYEGPEPFSNKYRREQASYTMPVFAYRRKYGNSITGGYVYRGNKNSSFYGLYICGDYTSKRIWGIKQQDRKLTAVREIAVSPQAIASFGTDEAGNIYVVGYEGMIYLLDLSGGNFDQVENQMAKASR
jgi:putative heme-binding domain-containing protein